MSPRKGKVAVSRRNLNSFAQNYATSSNMISPSQSSDRNCLPLSDNNVSTTNTNDSLMDRDWDIPCETDDINVSSRLL